MGAERTKGEGSQQQRPCGRWMAAAEPSPGEHDRRCSGPGAGRGKEGVRAAVHQSVVKSSPVSYRSYLAWIVFFAVSRSPRQEQAWNAIVASHASGFVSSGGRWMLFCKNEQPINQYMGQETMFGA
ncbi:predicted protein [Histoplasma capsulatum G186AR]|uniref:Uncharacterized protein n=1 Tax=Ajellomyces capsulatus (strain G186AR / H82 / ATCC MYA-2454 / RMSCC 2432) TaxID=447093 RepID=C0NE42_AJECG|nr:uncharacterized protein HCBG_02135 [Histoplasma capsulatum G186AR]EEH10490.1 predicted protein [Histoplasma capsulatum G186AR]